MSAQRQSVHSWADMGTAGPFIWTRSERPGQWQLWVHVDQVEPEIDNGRGYVYGSVGGVAADDGFGNLVLIGGLS